jgi:hypothetical protein
LIHIEDLHLEDLLTAEGEKLLREGGHAIRSLLHLEDIQPRACANTRIAGREDGEPPQRLELVVEVVCQTAGKTADGLHLSSLPQAFLRLGHS